MIDTIPDGNPRYCPFCSKVVGGVQRTPYDEPLHEMGDFLVVPALGMLLPGYLLLITRRHVGSFAYLRPDELETVHHKLGSYVKQISKNFGPYFYFEHGMGDDASSRSGACVDHAHIHLIPSRASVKHIHEALPWQRLKQYGDLAALRGTSYSYFWSDGDHHVVIEPGLPSQWIRRQVAAIHGFDSWDWAACASDVELSQTLAGLASPTA